MGDSPRTVRSVDRNDVRRQIEDLLRQVEGGEVQTSVADGGRTVAAIISEQDLARLRRYDHEVAEGEALLERMRHSADGIDDD